MSKKLILASSSPRRKELLAGLLYDFDIVKPNTDEYFDELLGIDLNLKNIVLEKAKAVFNNHIDAIIVAADTVVILENKILGKPKNENEAVIMLEELSGKTHQVATCFCILDNTKIILDIDYTDVNFSEIKKEDILFYVNSFKPYDKAGSYAIQEWIGMAFIENIKGNYYNVMGMPTHKIFKILKEHFDVK